MTKRLALCLVLLVALAACHPHVTKPDLGANELAAEGARAFERKKWTQAIDSYQKLKDRYPFSPYALMAETKIGDCLYLQENYAEATAAFQEFERMHPRNELVPYAIYMQGMCNYKQMLTLDRDQTPSAEAQRNFQRLVTDYPNSPQVAEAKQKIAECQERMAAQELYVAKWYERTGHPRSALNRLKYLLANYALTQSAAEGRKMLPEIKKEVAKEDAKGEHPSPLAPGPASLERATNSAPPSDIPLPRK
jgi:outer membrane protein assembly factor BamD